MMSRLPVSLFPRRSIDFGNFFGDSLDLFDPFDASDLLHRPVGMNPIDWIIRPPQLGYRPLDKYRVTLDVKGYIKEEIQITFSNETVMTVAGSHGEIEQITQAANEYDVRKFKKAFKVPSNVDKSKLASFITPNGTLVIEIPYIQEPPKQITQQGEQPSPFTMSPHVSATLPSLPMRPFSFNMEPVSSSRLITGGFEPRVINDGNGLQKMEVEMELNDFKPEQLQVTVKDNDLILKAERKEEDSSHSSRQYVYRQVTLPAGVDIEKMVSTFDGNHIRIEAPMKIVNFTQ